MITYFYTGFYTGAFTLIFLLLNTITYWAHSTFLVRDYVPKTDYAPVMGIMRQHNKVLGCVLDTCSGAIPEMLYLIDKVDKAYKAGVSVGLSLIAKVLVEEESIVRGFILLYVPLTIESQFRELIVTPDNRQRAELSYIVIDEKFRNRGLGTMLFSQALADFCKKQPNIVVIYARIKNDNQAAIGWHQQQGFMQVTPSLACDYAEFIYTHDALLYEHVVYKYNVNQELISGIRCLEKYQLSTQVHNYLEERHRVSTVQEKAFFGLITEAEKFKARHKAQYRSFLYDLFSVYLFNDRNRAKSIDFAHYILDHEYIKLREITVEDIITLLNDFDSVIIAYKQSKGSTHTSLQDLDQESERAFRDEL